MEIRQVAGGVGYSPTRPVKAEERKTSVPQRPSTDRVELSRQWVQNMEDQRSQSEAALLAGAKEKKSDGILDMLDGTDAGSDELDALSEQLEKQTMPTEFPLTGKASMEETAEENGNPICIFTASKGSMVVAAASGSVIVVNEDPEYGNNVWVDHGNGYVTIYRNQGEVKVEQGKTVTQGTTLMLITDSDSKLGYQIMKDGEYVDPMEMLNISG